MAEAPHQTKFTSPVKVQNDRPQIAEDVNTALDDLDMYKDLLTPRQRRRLRDLAEVGSPLEELPKMTVSDLDRLYALVVKMQEYLLHTEGGDAIFEQSNARELSALVSSIGSLMTLFLKSQERLDNLKQVAFLQLRLSSALVLLPEETRRRFLDSLEDYDHPENHKGFF